MAVHQLKPEPSYGQIAISHPTSGLNIFLTDEVMEKLGKLGRKIELAVRDSIKGTLITLVPSDKQAPYLRQISAYKTDSNVYVGRISWQEEDLKSMGIIIPPMRKTDLECRLHDDGEVTFTLPDTSTIVKHVPTEAPEDDGMDPYDKLKEVTSLLNSFIVSSEVPLVDFYKCDKDGNPIEKLERPFKIGLKDNRQV